jgi:hypothetical protein
MRHVMIKRAMQCAVKPAFLAVLAACQSDTGGSIRVQVAGSSRVENGIPAVDFADGWAASFTKILLVMGRVTVSGNAGTVSQGSSRVMDVTMPGVHDVGSLQVPQSRLSELGFTLAPPDDVTEAGNASAEDLELMQDSGWSIYAEGTLTRGATTMSFQWGFPGTSAYERCPLDMVVQGGLTVSTQLNVRGEMLFKDSLVQADAALRGQALAEAERADDLDQVITSDDLAAVNGSAFVGLAHADEGPFEVNSLWEYLEQLAGRMVILGTTGACLVTVNGQQNDGGQ